MDVPAEAAELAAGLAREALASAFPEEVGGALEGEVGRVVPDPDGGRGLGVLREGGGIGQVGEPGPGGLEGLGDLGAGRAEDEEDDLPGRRAGLEVAEAPSEDAVGVAGRGESRGGAGAGERRRRPARAPAHAARPMAPSPCRIPRHYTRNGAAGRVRFCAAARGRVPWRLEGACRVRRDGLDHGRGEHYRMRTCQEVASDYRHARPVAGRATSQREKRMGAPAIGTFPRRRQR